MNNSNAVELNSVTKRFGSQTAVDRLDLAVPSESIYGFIGPNGSGKTTTMRMILRIYAPDAGQITVLGETAGQATNDRIGYLPEERGLYRRMTVRKVLRYFARLKGVTRPDQAVTEWLERVDAASWANKRIDQLSKGMAQKVQFVSAVIARPQLIILDEPFSGLDPVNMDLLKDVVLELQRNGSTIIFSTHDMDVAERLCNRVFMVFRGEKVLDGTLDSIQADYGDDRLRVRMANGDVLPTKIPGVRQQTPDGRFTLLDLEEDARRPDVLRYLSGLGDLEHFETVRPSLHDIFVRIAGPEAKAEAEANAASPGVSA